jgi:predicted RecA/RadA family phage recombinase
VAQNYVQRGHAITIPASPVTAPGGSGIQYGGLFGVAVSDATIGDPVVICVTGVWTLPKVSALAKEFGNTVLWDSTAMLVTLTATGDNTPIGFAVSDAANPSPTVDVLLVADLSGL